MRKISAVVATILIGAASAAYSQGNGQGPQSPAFQQLQDTVSALWAQVTTLSAQMTTLSTQVSSLQSAVAALQVLLQYRIERFSPPTATVPAGVIYGLDGPGGTGEFRLVMVR